MALESLLARLDARTCGVRLMADCVAAVVFMVDFLLLHRAPKPL